MKLTVVPTWAWEAWAIILAAGLVAGFLVLMDRNRKR